MSVVPHLGGGSRVTLAEEQLRRLTNPFLDGVLGMKRRQVKAGDRTSGSVVYVPTIAACAATEALTCVCVEHGRVARADCRACAGAGVCTEGYIHAAILQTIAHEAAWQALSADEAITAQISTNFMHFGTLMGGPIAGQGAVIKRGKLLLIAEGQAIQHGVILTNVIATFTMPQKRGQ